MYPSNPNTNSANVPTVALIGTLKKRISTTELELGVSNISLLEEGDSNSCDAMSYGTARQTPRTGTRDSDTVVATKQNEPNSVDITDVPVKGINTIVHESGGFYCAWNPKHDLLASCSKEGAANLWDLGTGSKVILRETVKNIGTVTLNTNKVIYLDWNCGGSKLATGSSDGCARIWTADGVLTNAFGRHKGPILMLKWSKRGDYILSAGRDKRAIIWDSVSGICIQQFLFHAGPVLSIDWQDNTTFASCSVDNCIHICSLHCDIPAKTFRGHTNAVSEIKWNPQGTLLASCSDDMTMRLWSMNKESCLYSIRPHNKAIHTIKWSPTGPGTDYPNSPSILASAALDSTVDLWDVDKGTSKGILCTHTGFVYSVAFSPDGNLLASGGSDQCVHIWCTRSGRNVRSYYGNGEIYEVCWDSRGNKVGASANDGSTMTYELRKSSTT